MIFSCFPPRTKCEWSNLIDFANQYNAKYGKAYIRTACLDVGGGSSKEPEVQLEASGETPIVIERKSIVWPREYFSNHANEHDLFKRFHAELGNAFNDSVYLLTIKEDSLKEKRKKEVESIAKRIASIVEADKARAKSPGGVGEREPLWWLFRPLSEYEKDSDTPDIGIGIRVEGPMESVATLQEAFQENYETAKSGYADAFRQASEDAAQKFTQYADHLRLFLVQFHGGGSFFLNDDDVTGIIRSAQLPMEIDQVWVAQQNWIAVDDFEIIWERVR